MPPNGDKGTALRVRAIRDLAATVRGHRLDLGLSQANLAGRASPASGSSSSRRASPRPELGLALCLLDELGLALDVTSEAGESSSGELIDLDELLDEYRGS